MVYETVANIRIYVGGSGTNPSDADIGAMQAMADQLILAFTSSPNAYGAKAVEAMLCYTIYHNANYQTSHRDNQLQLPSILPLKLTEEMKQLLSGTVTYIETYEGY